MKASYVALCSSAVHLNAPSAASAWSLSFEIENAFKLQRFLKNKTIGANQNSQPDLTYIIASKAQHAIRRYISKSIDNLGFVVPLSEARD